MPAGQGVARLRDGVLHTITRSEASRGYLFVSSDHLLEQVLDVHDFVLRFGSYDLPHRRIDSCGRVQVSKKVFHYRPGTRVEMKLMNRRTLVVRSLDSERCPGAE